MATHNPYDDTVLLGLIADLSDDLILIAAALVIIDNEIGFQCLACEDIVTGWCPGPALSSLGLGSWQALVFVAAMGAGMALFQIAPRPLGESAIRRR